VKYLKGLHNTQGYIIAKMQEGYRLIRTKYERYGYISCLCVPQGGHYRNVSNRVIDTLRRRGFIERNPHFGGPRYSGSEYLLTKKGERQ
jgi:hypothetical protein